MKNLLSYLFKKPLLKNFPVSPLLLILIVLNETVIVKWLPNSEPDLAGYNVYYGKASRTYSNSIPAGLSTECIIPDLEAGYEYFFAVTAFDTAGNESQFSEEVNIFINGNKNVVTANQKNAYNFPNPFNPEIQQTQIRYHLAKPEPVSITIFDVAGNMVRAIITKISKNIGEHIEDSWDGKDENGNFLPNGIYYAHIAAESLNQYITIAVTK
jgi:hypothetical protein